MKGDLFVLRGGNADGPPETFTLIDALRATAVSVNGEMVDITSKDSNEWRELLAGGFRSMSISADGVWKGTLPQQALRDAALDGTLRNYQVDDSAEVIEGSFQVTAFEISGDRGDAQTYSCTLESADEPAVT